MSDSLQPLDYSLLGFSVHGILQARVPEWVAMPSTRGSFQPRDQTRVSSISCIGRQVVYQVSHQESPLMPDRKGYLDVFPLVLS